MYHFHENKYGVLFGPQTKIMSKSKSPQDKTGDMEKKYGSYLAEWWKFFLFSWNQNRPESPIVGKMLLESFSMMRYQMSAKPIYCA